MPPLPPPIPYSLLSTPHTSLSLAPNSSPSRLLPHIQPHSSPLQPSKALSVPSPHFTPAPHSPSFSLFDNDDSTALLMKNFYGYLQAGESRAAALNHAQRDVARTHDSPYYWAAFQLAGDPGPVKLTP